MNSFSLISSFLFLLITRINAGGLPLAGVYSSPLLARSYYSSPILAPEVLAASAPAFARAALPLVARSAPLLAPATFGYAQTIPQNIPPFASQVNIVNRALSGYVAAPLYSQYLAAQYAAPALLNAPLAYSSPVVSSLPVFRSAVAPLPLATPLAAPLATRLAVPAAAPLPLSVQPLQTQAIFRSFVPAVAPIGVAGRVAPVAGIAPVGVPAGIAPGGITRIAEGAQEGSQSAEDDSNRTTLLEPVPNSDDQTDSPVSNNDDTDNIGEQVGSEEISSN